MAVPQQNRPVGPQQNPLVGLPIVKNIHLNSIPKFKGEVALLTEFKNTCDSLYETFFDRQNIANYQNRLLLSTIRQKIKGDAKIQISSVQSNTWEEIKQALLNSYSDKRDSFTFTYALCRMKQQNGGNSFDFLHRIQENLYLQHA